MGKEDRGCQTKGLKPSSLIAGVGGAPKGLKQGGWYKHLVWKDDPKMMRVGGKESGDWRPGRWQGRGSG